MFNAKYESANAKYGGQVATDGSAEQPEFVPLYLCLVAEHAREVSVEWASQLGACDPGSPPRELDGTAAVQNLTMSGYTNSMRCGWVITCEAGARPCCRGTRLTLDTATLQVVSIADAHKTMPTAGLRPVVQVTRLYSEAGFDVLRGYDGASRSSICSTIGCLVDCGETVRPLAAQLPKHSRGAARSV